MHGLRQGKHGLFAGFNPINLNAPNYFYCGLFRYVTSDAKQNKKFWSGNFYTFQNRVEFTGPNIDINKIAQAGKDLNMILWFKSVKP